MNFAINLKKFCLFLSFLLIINGQAVFAEITSTYLSQIFHPELGEYQTQITKLENELKNSTDSEKLTIYINQELKKAKIKYKKITTKIAYGYAETSPSNATFKQRMKILKIIEKETKKATDEYEKEVAKIKMLAGGMDQLTYDKKKNDLKEIKDEYLSLLEDINSQGLDLSFFKQILEYDPHNGNIANKIIDKFDVFNTVDDITSKINICLKKNTEAASYIAENKTLYSTSLNTPKALNAINNSLKYKIIQRKSFYILHTFYDFKICLIPGETLASTYDSIIHELTHFYNDDPFDQYSLFLPEPSQDSPKYHLQNKNEFYLKNLYRKGGEWDAFSVELKSTTWLQQTYLGSHRGTISSNNYDKNGNIYSNRIKNVEKIILDTYKYRARFDTFFNSFFRQHYNTIKYKLKLLTTNKKNIMTYQKRINKRKRNIKTRLNNIEKFYNSNIDVYTDMIEYRHRRIKKHLEDIEKSTKRIHQAQKIIDTSRERIQESEDEFFFFGRSSLLEKMNKKIKQNRNILKHQKNKIRTTYKEIKQNEKEIADYSERKEEQKNKILLNIKYNKQEQTYLDSSKNKLERLMGLDVNDETKSISEELITQAIKNIEEDIEFVMLQQTVLKVRFPIAYSNLQQ